MNKTQEKAENSARSEQQPGAPLASADGPRAPQSSDFAAQASRLRPLRALFPYLRPYRGIVAATGLFLLLAAAATLVLPMALRRIIDLGFARDDMVMVDRYFLALFVVVMVLAAASACRYYFVSWLGERLVNDLRKGVFSHILALPAPFFDQAQSGELISRLTADTTHIKAAVGSSISVAVRNLILFAGSFVMMIATSPRLSLYALGAIAFIVLPMIVFGRLVRRRSRRAQDRLADASAYATQAVSAVKTVQSFANEAYVSHRFSASIERAFAAARAAIGIRALLTAFSIFTVFASIAGVLWMGARDVMSGDMSPGTLGQFLLYAMFAAGSFGALAQVWGEVSQAAGATERLLELLAEPPAPGGAGGMLKTPVSGTLTFERVSFSYILRQEALVIDGLHVRIKAGETVAIVGPSGAGKTTLFNLLLRFYEPTRGRILVDDMPVNTIDPKALRAQIALVPQEPVIFASTVADNIRFARTEASQAAIEAAAQAANAHDFITAFAQGYETPLGERGITLSGGQRQRIAIARALLKDAPILLLDEATSALDAQSELLVQSALDRLMHQRTTLVIAHRLATVRGADRILVLDKGKLVEDGNHATLMAKGGLYASLAALQFRTQEETERP